MNLKNSALAAAVTATLAMGAAGQASAFVYGASGLSIDNLTVSITGGLVTVNRFDFNLSNQATLNGVTLASTATCGGTPGPGNNNCTAAIGSMDAAAVNAPGSTVLRSNNQSTGGEFTFLGTAGANNYSNADSQIVTAELVNLGSPTETHNIAESLLNSATSASATSQIQSITGFTITFTVTEGGTFNLQFDADPDLMASIFGEAGSASAQANMNASFTLQQNVRTGGGALGFVNWNPQGTVVNDCISANLLGAGTCTEVADTQDLNINVGTTTNNTSAPHSWDPNVLTLTHFGINVTGLSAGTWSLTLNEVKSDNLARTVPEPGVLALVGMGLVGLFATSRRRKKLG